MSSESESESVSVYLMAIQDLCARYELAISSLLNIITEMSNTKNHYLKLLGQIRQEQQLTKQKEATT